MIKKIVKRVLGIKNSPAIVSDPLLSLRSSGNIKERDRNNLSALRVYHYKLNDGFCNIEIGEDNFLENNITLYAPDSKVKVGDRVYIGPNTNLNCRVEIEIGNDVMFSWGCTVMDTNAHSLKSEERKNNVIDWKKGWEYKDWSNVESSKIKIGDKCWIGFNSIILKGVELGEGCIVAAGSVVTKSFEPYSIIGGNPAELIKKTT